MPQLRRLPVLTLAGVAVTAVTSAVAVSSPTVLAHLQRTPARLHPRGRAAGWGGAGGADQRRGARAGAGGSEERVSGRRAPL